MQDHKNVHLKSKKYIIHIYSRIHYTIINLVFQNNLRGHLNIYIYRCIYKRQDGQLVNTRSY